MKLLTEPGQDSMIPIDIAESTYYGDVSNTLHTTTRFPGYGDIFYPLDTQFRLRLIVALEGEIHADTDSSRIYIRD